MQRGDLTVLLLEYDELLLDKLDTLYTPLGYGHRCIAFTESTSLRHHV